MSGENLRINIDNRDNGIRIRIMARKFWLGNGVFIICLAGAILSGVYLAYLIYNRSGYHPMMLPAFLALGVVIMMRIWLWYLFGEELIEVRDNCLYVKRSYGLYASKEKHIVLNNSIDVYMNKSDKWSWKGLRKKGVFRVSDGNKMLDFGIELDEFECKILLSHINNLLNGYKGRIRTTGRHQ
ncbi:MAG: hypothetical protein ABII90_06855 [Bacteroidota bacterium]